MKAISVRKQVTNNENTNERWPITYNDQEEQISSPASYVTLLTNKLGIAQEKAERACVATGFRSAQVAIDWLLQRSNNDNIIRTEFIFLLYPDVRLDKEIRTFRNELFRSSIKKTLLKSHQYLHAFKLSSFFHVPDQYVYTLHKIFDSVIEQCQYLFKRLLRIILHSTNDYLVLVPDNETKEILQTVFDRIKQQFEQIVPNVSILPARKSIHLTLLHGLSSLFNLSVDQQTSLLQLACNCFDLNRTINWTLRLYSREKSSTNEILYRVISSSKETIANNCLLLKNNDLFAVFDNGRIGEQEYVFGK